MGSYILLYKGDSETFKVPEEKKVYLSRSEAVSDGTATVRDLKTNLDYEIPENVTVVETGIKVGATVELQFVARTNDKILAVDVDVTRQR
jgi:hypothetical protein